MSVRATSLTLRAAAAAALLSCAGAALAADVKVSGLHNCCPGCSGGITNALNAAGAKNVTLTKTEVTFSADEADKAVKALHDAGYGGKVEGAKAPEAVEAKGYKATTLKFTGAHNCCGACSGSIVKALKDLGTVTIKPRETTFTLTSDKEIDAEAAIKALRAGGYNAKLVK